VDLVRAPCAREANDATFPKPRLSYNWSTKAHRRREEDDDMHTPTPDPASPVPPAGLGRRRRRRPVLPVAAALLGLALAGAACSSDPSTPGVAGAGTTPTTAGTSTANQSSNGPTPAQRAQLLAYSQCMRSHGVPDFPDPDSQGRISIQSHNGSGLDPNSPAFQNADKACRSKMPQPTAAQQAQALQNALKTSRCMRAHGIKDFPDPQTSGGHISLSIHSSPGSDLNPNNPLFAAAQKACMPNAPTATSNGGKGGSGTSASGSGSVFGAG
jgi:hypothetical protein